MTLLLTLLVGFSVVAAPVLYIAYALFLQNANKSPRALATGALLLTVLSLLQLGHLTFFQTGNYPLDDGVYRLSLFAAPALFYLFSTSILFDESRFSVTSLAHLLPIGLVLVPRLEVSIAVLFCIGTGYSLWLTHLIYNLRSSRKRSGFELFFLGLFTVTAIGILVLGFSLPYIDKAYFYGFYTVGIGIALVLVVLTLLSFPELLEELAEAAKLSYVSSTLKDVDIAQKKDRLSQCMDSEQLYQDENLSLASLAQAVGLTTHQLSELINTEYQVGFSRYVREHRIAAAQQLLKAEPQASILSISLEVGFKSQSNFYAAFKEITGQSPGTFRQASGNS